MSIGNELFKGLVMKALDEGLKSNNSPSSDPKRPNSDNSDNIIYFIILGILFFVGNEAAKVIFRKNFGVEGINRFQIVICFICFLILGVLGVISFFDPVSSPEDAWWSSSSFLVCGIFYILLSFVILIKGYRHRNRAKEIQNYTDFEGETDLFSFLESRGWSENNIRFVAEPVYLLLLGAAILFYNPFAAIPIIFCALSIWGIAILKSVFSVYPLHPTMNTQHHQNNTLGNMPSPNRVNIDLN